MMSIRSTALNKVMLREHVYQVIFIGKYPNWPENISTWTIYPEVLEYWESPTAYWKKYGRYHPLLSENAFDPITGGYGDGHRYHTNFSKLGLSSDYADYVTFTELIGVPVSGVMNYRDPVQKAKDEAEFERLLHNPEHLAFMKHLLFEAEGKVIFISRGVYNILRTRQQELFGLDSDILNTPFPLDSYEFRVLYQHGSSYIIAAQIFSSIDNDAYYPRYRRVIDSIVKEQIMEWEVTLQDATSKLKVQSGFKDLYIKIAEQRPGLSTLAGITINPIRQILPRMYQIPVLANFFNGRNIDYSIHCLIHSIKSLEVKALRLPLILKYYQTIRHLLEPENQKLLDACLAECQRMITNKEDGMPPQAKEIKQRLCRFSFHTLRCLGFASTGYHNLEKAVITEIWDTLLDNIDSNGCSDKERIYFSMLPGDTEAVITIYDTESEFDFDYFIGGKKAIETYINMQKFGEMTIESGGKLWSSDHPRRVSSSERKLEGNVITLRFVITEQANG